MDRQAAAALQLTERRARQAFGAIRKATRLLAQTAGGFDSVGVREVRGPGDIEAVGDLIRLALAEHDQVDVVLLLPSDRQNQPHGANNGSDRERTTGA